MGRIPNAPNVISVAIPLNQPISKTLPAVKALVEARQRERLRQIGIAGDGVKSLKAAFGPYETNAKELRGRSLYVALLLYGIWIDLGKPTIGSSLMQTTRDLLLSRPRAKWLPGFLLAAAMPDARGKLQFTDDQVRNMRRSIKKAQEVCKAVSNGRFPI